MQTQPPTHSRPLPAANQTLLGDTLSSSNRGDVPREIPSLNANDIASVGASPTNVALENNLETTTSDSEKLKVALSEIDSLRTRLAEAQAPSATGLRRRGGGPSTEVAVNKTPQVTGGKGGIPVTVVVALVVGVFAVTYLLF